MTSPSMPPSAPTTATALPELGGLVVRPFDMAADAEAMAALVRGVSTLDGLDWFPTAETLPADWAPGPSFEPSRDALSIFDGPALVAVVAVDWRERTDRVVHWTEIWVRPSHRRRGIGRRLLDWAEAHARRAVDEGTGGRTDLSHHFGAAAPESSVAANALLAGAGYRVARWFFDMRRSLADPIPEAALPPGIELRPVRPEHHRAIWAADIEGFLDHWESTVRLEEDFAALFDHPHTDTSLWRVAWDGDEVVGLVMNVVEPRSASPEPPTMGTLEHVSVRRPWRGRGIAGALIAASLHALRERGLREAELGVDAENPSGALGLYERFGFRRQRTWLAYRKPF